MYKKYKVLIKIILPNISISVLVSMDRKTPTMDNSESGLEKFKSNYFRADSTSIQ
jgi:hypothetical protein